MKFEGCKARGTRWPITHIFHRSTIWQSKSFCEEFVEGWRRKSGTFLLKRTTTDNGKFGLIWWHNKMVKAALVSLHQDCSPSSWAFAPGDALFQQVVQKQSSLLFGIGARFTSLVQSQSPLGAVCTQRGLHYHHHQHQCRLREVKTQILLNLWPIDVIGLTRQVSRKWTPSSIKKPPPSQPVQCVLKQACSRMAFSFWTATMVSLITQSDRENSDGEST